MDNYTPKKQSKRNITHQVILTETVRRFNKHCLINQSAHVAFNKNV